MRNLPLLLQDARGRWICCKEGERFFFSFEYVVGPDLSGTHGSRVRFVWHHAKIRDLPKLGYRVV